MASPDGDRSRVVVLLATYNGAPFLDEQIDSIEAQDWNRIDIWASDDGSTDDTVDILRRRQQSWQRGTFHVVAGPRKGFAENFRSLICNPRLEADYVAFCDQDDIWDRDKIDTAIETLRAVAADRPGLYCGRTRLVDRTGQPIGYSQLFRRPPAFRNALVQSIAGGNTMVLNRQGWELMAESGHRTSFISHDWWCYLMISGGGGQVFYDASATISYRQHGANAVGDNRGMKARLQRIRGLMGGQLIAWNKANLMSLAKCEDLLTDDNQAVAGWFQKAHETRSRWSKMRYLGRCGVHRQTIAQDVMLWLAALLGRI